MATFHGDVRETWTVNADPDEALAFFADLDANIRHHTDLQSHDKLDDRTLRMVLKPQRSGRTTFEPRYTLRYTTDPATRTLRWTEVAEPGGTMQITGEARFEGAPGGPTTVRWAEEVHAEVPVNRIVAKAIAPVAEGLIRKGIRGFVERMLGELGARA